MGKATTGMALGALIGAGASLVAASAASANILINPSFESDLAWGYIFTLGDDTGYSTQAAHTGSRSFKFSTAADIINLSQSADFVSGQEYELSFWILNYGVGNDFLGAYVHTSDPVPWDVPIFEGGVGTGLESWEFVSAKFVVPQGDYWRLVFHGYDNNAAYYIDDVSLTATPSPGGGAVALVALAGFGGVRRRRN